METSQKENRFPFTKQNFVEGQKVIIHSLDGSGKEYAGTIRGKQEMVVCDNYIVQFDDPNAFPIYPYSCVTLIESCIKPDLPKEVPEEKLLEMIANAAKNPFIPFAHYDKGTNSIRMELMDCSVTEERIDENIIVMLSNRDNKLVGLVIENAVRDGVSVDEVHTITDILSRLLK